MISCSESVCFRHRRFATTAAGLGETTAQLLYGLLFCFDGGNDLVSTLLAEVVRRLAAQRFGFARIAFDVRCDGLGPIGAHNNS